MRKILLISLLYAFCLPVFGDYIHVDYTNSLETNCNGGTFDSTYYLNPSLMFYPADILGGNNASIQYNYVLKTGNIAIYNPIGALKFKNNIPNFAFQSNIKPKGEQTIIVGVQDDGAGTIFANHATKRSDIAGQIVFRVGRAQENGKDKEATYTYMKEDSTVVSNYKTNASFSSNIISDNECLNIYVGRCGDGILDNGNQQVIESFSTQAGQLAGGEQCDPNDPSHTGRGIAGCSPTCTPINTATPKITLVKELVSQTTNCSGGMVTWKLTFSNAGATTVNQVVLEDWLPSSVNYVSSSISNINGATLGSYYAGGQNVIQYSGFSLQPGQNGYMLITGQIKPDPDNTHDYIHKTMNYGILTANGGTLKVNANTLGFDYLPICPTPAVAATCKNITINTNTNSKDVNVLCYGDKTTTSTPMNINCGNGQSFPGVAKSTGIWSATCNYSSISQAANATISCSVNGATNAACTTTMKSSCSLTSDSLVSIVDNDRDNGEVTYTCSTKDGQNHNLQIICGDGQKSSTETNTNRMSHTCQYSNSDYTNAGSRKTVTAKCIVDNSSSPACTVDTILDKGILGFCGNGIPEGYEQCDAGGPNGEGVLPDGRVCKKGCTVCDKCNDEVTQCLSLGNGNTSVQSKEILPFWWRMYKPAYIVNDNQCTSKNQEANIKRSSMKCAFSLIQPKTDRRISLGTYSCSTTMFGTLALFQNFYHDYWKYAFGNYSINLEKYLGTDNNIFGEYKLRLDQVDYDYCVCTNNSCGWKSTQINNVCETDFAITRPYLIQKSAFGTSPKAADAKLTNFYDVKGDPLINKTDMADVMVLDANAYNGNTDAQFLISSEALKIAKLAVKLNVSQIPTALQGLNVKKVPNKAIYYIESSSQKTIELQPSAISTKTPFTIITKNINLTIVGSLEINGMFVANNGTINFKEDPSTKCSAPQVVKGIFVAGNGFTTTKLDNSSLYLPWCKYGNLQVKGILIGKNIDTLVQNRRSNLNNWFRVSGSATSQKIQRRNQIFNGASLLIEYNPDLWAQLPPGADQFVNLLDVYKK